MQKELEKKIDISSRLSEKEALWLFEKAPLSWLGEMASEVNRRKNGDTVFFNRNFHLEPTNVCIYSCTFCSYSRKIKKREEGWELTMEEMMDIIRSYDHKPVTEVHIVGGVLPQYDLEFYTTLFKKIKAHRPDLHIKALTPVEYHYIFKKAKVSYEEGMKMIRDSGVGSLPGGGAEIFDEDIRSRIAGGKCSSDQWLEIHRIWHELGMRSNATILYGHIENYKNRINHLKQLRDLQDKTGGFQTFIPLKFRNENNEMSHLPETSIIEDLKMYAISRLFLDNFPHLKSYWPMIGRDTTQLSLSFGVDDIDGTIDDTTKIYSMAGAEEKNPALSTYQLVQLIKTAHKRPVERDTLYNVLQDYSDVKFEEEKEYRGYVSLPVVDN